MFPDAHKLVGITDVDMKNLTDNTHLPDVIGITFRLAEFGIGVRS